MLSFLHVELKDLLLQLFDATFVVRLCLLGAYICWQVLSAWQVVVKSESVVVMLI